MAEAAIVFHATRLGIPVFRPLLEHCRYDLVMEIGDRLQRVQCKWAPLNAGVIVVRLVSSRYTSNGNQVQSTYSADEIDAAAVYCEKLDSCYLIPVGLFAGMRQLHLRVQPPRNRQRASLHWASQYELRGAVAQPGRASVWHTEGRGFESHQLHSSNGEDGGHESEPVGAHRFRGHFGWYMERAAAGERFLITRHGKPYARLIPATDRPSSRARATGRSR